MQRIQLDESTRKKLNGFTGEAQVCDEDGQCIGLLLSSEVYEAYRSAFYARLDIPVDDEELQRRRAEEGGTSLAEIWTELGRT